MSVDVVRDAREHQQTDAFASVPALALTAPPVALAQITQTRPRQTIRISSIAVRAAVSLILVVNSCHRKNCMVLDLVARSCCIIGQGRVANEGSVAYSIRVKKVFTGPLARANFAFV